MKKNLLIGLFVLILTIAFTGVVSADKTYKFELSEGASRTDDAGYYYLKISVPQISGMSNEEQQEDLNGYFLSYVDYLTDEYTADKEYFEANFEGDESPRFGYEYFYEPVYENDDYFVFKTTLFYAAGSSMSVNEYWTLNKKTGELTELSDLADSERLTGIRSMILDAMKLENETEEVFWLDEENFDIAFSYIEEYQHWYVNEAGNLVITFDKYEIAPGAYGESQFEITDDKAALIKDEKYSFDIHVGETVEDQNTNWYLKISLPVVSGLKDKAEEENLNTHFAEIANGIKKEYAMSVATAEESASGEDGPHFGYEYGYEIIADTDDYFTFKTVAFFAAGSSMTSSEFWTLSKNTGSLLQWEDVVPEDRIEKIHDQILNEMKAANKTNNGIYFIDDDTLDTAFSNVAAYHHWYLNEDGKLVIAFDKYEVAVGAQGTPEFVID